MDNNEKKERKEPEKLDEDSQGKTNAQLAAEAMERLVGGKADALDMVILQRYLLKKPSQTKK